MRPWRLTIEAFAVAPHEHAIGLLWDEIDTALARLGVILETGASFAMDQEDVIPGSPLAVALQDKRGGVT